MHDPMNGDEEFIILIGGGQAQMKSAKAGPNFSPQSPGGQSMPKPGGSHEDLLAIAADLRAKADQIEAICKAMKY